MIRDISNIKRDLEDKKNNDIIYKKNKLQEIFEADPDLNEILGKKDKRPLNKFADKEHPTTQELEERNLILEYNKRIDKKQIIPMLKLNGINKEVLNFIMYDINDDNVSYTNESIKNQIVEVMCLVHQMPFSYRNTKAHSSKIARILLDNYIHDTGDTRSELVIIPLVISYELVKVL